MRPQNYIRAPYSDGMVHFTVSIKPDLHQRMIDHLQKENKTNRTQFIRKAIAEKLERDNAVQA